MRKSKVTKVTSEGPIIGAGEGTGVFLSKSDFNQLIEVIARAKARDKLADKVGMKSMGGGNVGGIEQPSMGTISIQIFVRKLADAYNLPKDQFYGVNKHGEFIRWVTITKPN